MRDKTKRDNLVLGCGWGLVADSVFLLIMLIIGQIYGVYNKMPENEAIKIVLIITFGGLLMLFMAYRILIREYEKPKLEKVE